jgi:phytol kinase
MMPFNSEGFVNEIPLIVLIIGVVLSGLWVSNIIYDHGVPQYISRKVGHGAGGMAFFGSYLLSSAWWPIFVSAALSVLFLVAHLFKPSTFRGVGGSGRDSRIMAEVWFPLVAVPVYGISWLWLKQPAVAVASLLFMAWGDGVTGLVRSQIYHRAVKGWWGSLAMLIVCLAIAWVFIEPFWIGAVASLLAVVTERVFGDYGIIKWADDNWAIPVISATAMLGLMALTGTL